MQSILSTNENLQGDRLCVNQLAQEAKQHMAKKALENIEEARNDISALQNNLYFTQKHLKNTQLQLLVTKKQLECCKAAIASNCAEVFKHACSVAGIDKHNRGFTLELVTTVERV